jgi:hypothetical protein
MADTYSKLLGLSETNAPSSDSGKSQPARASIQREETVQKQVNQQTGIPESQHASKPESQNTGKPATQKSGNAKPLSNKVSTEKVTYRFHAEGKYAVEDMKTTLARRHGIKASLEEIAEACILLAYDDLLANQHASKLASRLARTPANKHSS